MGGAVGRNHHSRVLTSQGIRDTDQSACTGSLNTQVAPPIHSCGRAEVPEASGLLGSVPLVGGAAWRKHILAGPISTSPLGRSYVRELLVLSSQRRPHLCESEQTASLVETNPREILFAHAQWASRAVPCVNPRCTWHKGFLFLCRV